MKLVQNFWKRKNKVNFVHFQSINAGVNLDHVEWYVFGNQLEFLRIITVSGRNFYIKDKDEISYFFNVLELEFDDET